MGNLVKKNDSYFSNLIKDFFSDDLLADKYLREKTFPLCNVSEEDDKYLVEFSLPGIDKNNLKIKRDGNELTINYKKETHEEEKGKNYHRREFKLESFEKMFVLPENVNYDGIDSEYKEGLLKITIPKKEITKTKSKNEGIEIKVK